MAANYLTRKTVKRLALGCMLAVGSLLSGGCWDRQELQDRAMVLAVSIDAADPGIDPTDSVKSFVQPYGEKPYRIGLQVFKLAAGGGTSGESMGSSSKKPETTYTIFDTGQSLDEVFHDMYSMTSKSIWLEHIQTVIISESAIKNEGLKPILDFFTRNPYTRWRIRVFVTPGSAAELVSFQPPTGEQGGIFLSNLMKNQNNSLYLGGARTDLGYVIRTIDNDGDVVVPRVEMKDGIIKVNGVAVFKKDKFVGYWDNYTTGAARMARGVEKSGIIAAPCPEHPGRPITFQFRGHKTSMTPHMEDGNPYFTLEINMNGSIGELYGCKHDLSKPEEIHLIEETFAQAIKTQVLHGVRTQQELGIDLMYFKKKLQDRPKMWEAVKDRWDEIYPTIPVIVSVNVSIEDYGEHK